MTSKAPLIVCTPGICGGAPRLAGTRTTIFNLWMLIGDQRLDEFLREQSEPGRDVLIAAAQYCRARQCEKDMPEHYCDGCSLRRIHEEQTPEDFEKWAADIKTSDSVEDGDPNGVMFLGSREELREQWRGLDGWVIGDRIFSELMN